MVWAWLPTLLPLLVLLAVMSLISWLRSQREEDASALQAPAVAADAQTNVQKLRGYHDLAKDALERAHSLHTSGTDTARAAKAYRTASQSITEGLALVVPSAGLRPAYSNTAAWRADLTSWQPQVHNRLWQLEKGSGSRPPPASIPSSTDGWSAPRQSRPPPQQQPPANRAPAIRKLASQTAGRAASPTAATRARSAVGEQEESRLRDVVLGEVLQRGSSVRWSDVAGLASAKQALQEMVILPALRADLFRGLRAPARGLLLYGPPGNGKTLLAKALAAEARATFFAISASSLTSKWHGEAEKLVRALFRLASDMQPSIIFVDEIDSILSERSSGEHEASRRLKTEFLLQFDGISTDQSNDRIVVIGATNRPWELDEAMRRRLQKRIYVPLPNADARRALLLHLLDGQPSRLSSADIERVVRSTDGHSGSDLAALCREAAMVPIRELGSAIAHVTADSVRPMEIGDFAMALEASRPSVSRQQLGKYVQWTKDFGAN